MRSHFDQKIDHLLPGARGGAAPRDLAAACALAANAATLEGRWTNGSDIYADGKEYASKSDHKSSYKLPRNLMKKGCVVCI